MNANRKLKMKYKLILTVLFPSLVFLFFIAWFLKNELRILQQAQNGSNVVSVVDEMGEMLNRLLTEKDSFILLNLPNAPSLNGEIPPILLATDASIKKFQDAVKKISYLNENPTTYANLQSVLSALNELNLKRSAFFGKNQSIEDIETYYDSITEKIFTLIESFAKASPDLTTAMTLKAYIEILNEKDALNHEKVVGTEILLQPVINQEKIYEWLSALVEQKTFQTAFKHLATDEQEQLYKQVLEKSKSPEIDAFRNAFKSGALTVEQKANLGRWWQLLTEKTNAYVSIEEKLVENIQIQSAKLEAAKKTEFFFILFSILATLIATALFIVYNLRSLTNQLQDETETLANAGNEILSSISEASSGTAETAAAVSETTSTVEELKQTAQISAEKAKNVSEFSDEALKILKASEKSVETTIEGMNNIHDGMSTISESIIKLSEQSQAIGKIIDSVNELAQQSHLLAVNAAIEAAKAGDQGKGFAVVAGEVRSLAEQSKQATIQVRNILSDIQNATSAAVMATEQGSKAVTFGMNQSKETSDSIRAISNQISIVAEAASQIAISSEQQLIGVGQVTIAMTNIKEASNQQVDHMRQIETGVQGLNAVSHNLKTLVSEYKL